MPLDPVRVAESRAWFQRARNDLRAGDLDLTTSPPLCADACFHAQQAAEKSLKGFLCWHLKPVRKTHDLKDVGENCSAIDPTLESVVRAAVRLSEYAWRYRYPGNDMDPGIDETRDALRRADALFRAVLATLPPEVAP